MAKKGFMYEGAKLWNSISNGIKTIENISEFKTLLKKWNGSPCICNKMYARRTRSFFRNKNAI